LLLSALLASPLFAQDDSGVVIRSNTRVVEVDVAVRASNGKPVQDLQQKDFPILDNGKPRLFTVFSVNRASSNRGGAEQPIDQSGSSRATAERLQQCWPHPSSRIVTPSSFFLTA
jgi:hypothetical protein